MLGKRPYLGKDRKEIKENMLSRQAQVRIDELPYKWSPHAIDFINKVLAVLFSFSSEIHRDDSELMESRRSWSMLGWPTLNGKRYWPRK